MWVSGFQIRGPAEVLFVQNSTALTFLVTILAHLMPFLRTDSRLRGSVVAISSAWHVLLHDIIDVVAI